MLYSLQGLTAQEEGGLIPAVPPGHVDTGGRSSHPGFSKIPDKLELLMLLMLTSASLLTETVLVGEEGLTGVRDSAVRVRSLPMKSLRSLESLTMLLR